jgi:hypothetical protein
MAPRLTGLRLSFGLQMVRASTRRTGMKRSGRRAKRVRIRADGVEDTAAGRATRRGRNREDDCSERDEYDGSRGRIDVRLVQPIRPTTGQSDAETSAPSTCLRKVASTRARVGPMLPIGIPSDSEMSLYDMGGSFSNMRRKVRVRAGSRVNA